MSALFTDVITVYNCYKDQESDKWSRTTVKGVQWTHGKRQLSVANGIATEKTVESITIDFNKTYEGRKPYLEPLDYKKLSVEEKIKYWTLDHERGLDYIVLGDSSIDIDKPTELKEHFQYVKSVTTVTDNRNRPRLKHIKVVCE